MNEIINPAIILEASGEDKSILKELIDLFTEQSPIQIQELQDAVDTANYGSIQKLAHKIKGSSSYFGAEKMILTAKDIELAAQREDIQNCKSLLLKLEANYLEVKKTIPLIFN